MLADGQHYNYTNVRLKAEQEAIEKFKGVKKVKERNKLIKSHVLTYMKDNWDEENGNIAAKALQYGREVTYTQSLDSPDRAGLVRATGGFNKLLNQYPALRLVAPFVRTPTNLLSFYLNRTAGASIDMMKLGKSVAMQKVRKEVAEEVATSKNASEILGRFATGSLFTYGAITAYNSGKLTGGGPKDPERRRLMEASGWQPYSMRVGDKWYSYKRFDPFATFLGVVADVAESINEQGQEDDSSVLEAVVGHAIFATSRNVMSKSYLTGLARFGNVLTNPEQYSDSYLESTVASGLPFSGLLGQTAGSEEHYKEIRGILDAVRARYGLTSETDLEGLGIKTQLDTKRNVFGEPLSRPHLFKPFPVHYTEIKDDEVMQEMVRLKRPFGPPKKITNGIDTTKYFNNKGVSFYDRWQENHGKVRLQGRTLKQALKALIKTREYQSLSPEPYDSLESPRVTEIRKILRKYRQEAWARTLNQFPEVAKENRRNKQIKHYRSLGQSIQPLLQY